MVACSSVRRALRAERPQCPPGPGADAVAVTCAGAAARYKQRLQHSRARALTSVMFLKEIPGQIRGVSVNTRQQGPREALLWADVGWSLMRCWWQCSAGGHRPTCRSEDPRSTEEHLPRQPVCLGPWARVPGALTHACSAPSSSASARPRSYPCA